MEYIFKINFVTDGDFGFDFVPCGMKYDGYERYWFEHTYSDFDGAVNDIKKICNFLKEYIKGGDYILEDVKSRIDNFVKAVGKKTKGDIFCIEIPMYGNYEGTEFIFRAVPKKVNFDFYLTEEEEKLFNKNAHEVTCGDIKRAVMELFRDKE